ncbi:MAG: hypothetical protein ACQCN4_01455 [Candidatus Bathyarchaeia archaeon]
MCNLTIDVYRETPAKNQPSREKTSAQPTRIESLVFTVNDTLKKSVLTCTKPSF